MTKHIRIALAGLLALFVASAALAQTFPTVPGQSVIGRLGTAGVSGPSQAIPITTLQSQFNLIASAKSNIINVKDAPYSATGNGTTNDYAAINAAITALASTCGTVYIPPGTYLMSSALAPVSCVNIRGAGPESTIIKNAGTALSPNNVGLLIYGTLTGDHTTATTYAINAPTEGTNTVTATTAADAGNFAAGNIVMVSGGLHATNFWYPSWTTTVTSVNAGTGVITLDEKLPAGGANWTLVQKVLVQPHDIKVSDLTILGANNEAVQISVTKNVTIDNVLVRAGSGGVSGASFNGTSSRNLTVQNSKFVGVYVDFLGSFDGKIIGNTLTGGNLLLDGGAQGNLVLGNTITDSTANGSASASISIASTAQRNKIIGNSIVNVPSGFAGVTVPSTSLREGGNIINGNSISGAGANVARGIDFNSSASNTAVGNWLNNLTTGITATNTSVGQVVDGNTLISVTTPYSADATSSFREPHSAGAWVLTADADTTPSVANGTTFQIFNAGATSITNFDDGVDRQEIALNFGDANTTLVASGSLKLANNINFNPPAQTVMRLTNILGTWYETSRTSITPSAATFSPLAIGAGSYITSSGPGGALTSAAYTAIGTSGATIPLLNGANTFSAANTFNTTVFMGASNAINMANWWTITQGATSGVEFGSGHGIAWASGVTNSGAGLSGDTFLTRSAAGIVRVGTTSSDALGSMAFANLAASGSVLSASATLGVGYATGAGGAVTQATNRNTGVTLNKVSGAITLFSAVNAAVSAATANAVTVTNSAVAATDTIVVSQKSGTDKYMIFVTAVAAGSFQITFFTTGGTTNEAPVFNYSVIKGVAS